MLQLVTYDNLLDFFFTIINLYKHTLIHAGFVIPKPSGKSYVPGPGDMLSLMGGRWWPCENR